MTRQPSVHIDVTDVPVIVAPRTATPRRVHRRRTAYELWAKPVIDRVGAAILLLALLPLLAATALAVHVELGRPLLFRQRRVGKDGHVFEMIKFRTMHPCRRHAQQPIRHADRRVQHKSSRDPRHTSVGRFLRRYSLDELPQLLNVLKGEMSLVGPRPELESVVRRYEPWQHRRHQVKPGITGLWQVTARGDSDGDMHLHTDIDLDYLERASLRTDLGILVRTLPAAMGLYGKGT